MTRLLLRAPKGPFDVVPAEVTLADNLIGNNSGNLVFIESAHRLLATHGTTITPDRFDAPWLGAERINERFDAYVVPLANAFRVSFRDSLIRMTELIERLRIPVVVLGVGAQANVRFEPASCRPWTTSCGGSSVRCSIAAHRSGSAASTRRRTCRASGSATSRSSGARRCSSTATGSRSVTACPP